MSAELIRGRFLFQEVKDRGYDLPLGSVTKDGGVEFRSDLDIEVWNPSDDVSGYKRVLPDDFVIGLRSFQSGIGHSSIEALVSPAYTVLRPISHLVHPPYFRYMFKSSVYISRLENVAQGIRQGRTIATEDFYNIECRVPAITEQRSIADYLDIETVRIDALLSKKQRMLDLLRERRNEMRREAFESLDHAGSMRRQFRRLVVRSHAGEVIDQTWWGDGDEMLFTCATEPVLSNFPSFTPERRTSGEDILLTRNGTPYIHLPPAGAIFTNVVQRVVLCDGVDREFIAIVLDVASRQMHRQGVSIDSLNFTMWKELRVPLPTLLIQQALVSRVHSVERRLTGISDRLERQIELLRERRQALITAAVTGELEIPGVAA